MKKNEIYTWEQISKAEAGTIFLDRFDDGIRFMILKGGSSLCAYVGVPEDHPLSNFEYNDLPISCHGGLTFSGGYEDYKSTKSPFPKGFYFYGWDYAHSGDYCDYYDTPIMSPLSDYRKNDTKWLVGMVEDDSWSAIYDFKKLVALAEKIHNKVDQGKNHERSVATKA